MTIIITIQGGMIDCVITDTQEEVVIVDYDTDSQDPCIRTIPQTDPDPGYEFADACVITTESIQDPKFKEMLLEAIDMEESCELDIHVFTVYPVPEDLSIVRCKYCGKFR